MGKLLLIGIITFFLSLNSTAQSIDTIFPQMRNIESIRAYNDSIWTIITGDAHLHFVNRKGELIGSVHIGEDIGYNKTVLNIFDGYQAEQDSFTYIHTFDSHCDYFENELLLKVSLSGGVVDTLFLPEDFQLSSALPYPRGNGHPNYVYPHEESLVIFYNRDSMQLLPINYFIYKTAISDDGDIAVLARDSIFYFVMDADQFVLSDKMEVDYLSYRFHDLFFTSAGELIFVSESIMLWFDSGLQNPDLFETDDGFKIIFAEETNEQIVLATSDQEGNMYAGAFGFNKQELFGKALGYQELFFSDVLWIKDSLYVFTGTEYYPDDKSYSFLKTIDFGTTPEDKVDIAIDDIKFNQVRHIGGYHCYGDSTNLYSVENITMTITNLGTQPINRLLITPLKSYCYFFCDEEILGQNEIVDMDLLPGETREFSIGHMGVHVNEFDTEELCLIAVQPDMHIDANHKDNRICFSVTVSTDDENASNKPALFPNPVTDVLYLSNYDEVKEITISNANGIYLLSGVDHANAGVDMGQFTPGMYFVKMEMRNGEQFVERVVKTH